MLAAGAGGSCMDHSVSEKEIVGLERQQGASSCWELGGREVWPGWCAFRDVLWAYRGSAPRIKLLRMPVGSGNSAK